MQNIMNYKRIHFFVNDPKKGGGHFIRIKRLMDVIKGGYKKFLYINLPEKKIKDLIKKIKIQLLFLILRHTRVIFLLKNSIIFM